jgi:hypothetical protein
MITPDQHSPPTFPAFTDTEGISPYVREVWETLSPGERLARSWAMRKRIPDLKAWHDAKLFPRA